MIFSAIRAIFEDEKSKRSELFVKYLGTTDVRTMQTEPRLTLNENNKSAFQKLVIDVCKDDEVNEYSRNKSRGQIKY